MLLADGKHEVTTALQRIELADRIALEPAAALRVDGFEEDTLVRRALELVAEAAGASPDWAVRIDKQIPVAACDHSRSPVAWRRWPRQRRSCASTSPSKFRS